MVLEQIGPNGLVLLSVGQRVKTSRVAPPGTDPPRPHGARPPGAALAPRPACVPDARPTTAPRAGDTVPAE
jgi:hypothetical protein